MLLPSELLLYICSYLNDLSKVLVTSRTIRDKLIHPYFLIPYITRHHPHLVTMYREVSLIHIPLQLDYPLFIREEGVKFLMHPRLNEFARKLMNVDLNEFFTGGMNQTIVNAILFINEEDSTSTISLNVLCTIPGAKYIIVGNHIREGEEFPTIIPNFVSFTSWKYVVIHMLLGNETCYQFKLKAGKKFDTVMLRSVMPGGTKYEYIYY